MTMYAEMHIGPAKLEIVRGDITRQETEAIVNAANRQLAPGGGVAGAIHRAAGPELWAECQKLGGCETGEAKLTRGYRLKTPYVLHTVGPVYRNAPGEAALLAACYRNSLQLALDHGIKSVSFPAISTGIFGYPLREAAAVSLEAVVTFLRDNPGLELVRFVLFGEADFRIFEETLRQIV